MITEFLTRLATRYASPIMSVTLRTQPELLKFKRGSKRTPENACPFVGCERLSRGAFALGTSGETYGVRVNNAVEKHGENPDHVTFAVASLWGGYGEPGPVAFTASHKPSGKLYLNCFTPTNGLPHKTQDEWRVDGTLLEGEALEAFKRDWLAGKSEVGSAKQAEHGLTDVSKQPSIRLPHLENVEQLLIHTKTGGVIMWDKREGIRWDE